MSIFPANNRRTHSGVFTLTHALSFRAKLLLSLMLLVVALTTATLYLAERNLRQSHQRALDTQFENQLRAYLAMQETRSGTITERCRALSQSVRLRAALEERDVDDLYRNALAELQGILDSDDDGVDRAPVPSSVRAAFFRFLDRDGAILSPENQLAGYSDRPELDRALGPMGRVLPKTGDQSVGFIALNHGNQPDALREVVLTKIHDQDGRMLGALALGFRVTELQQATSDGAIKNGIWFNRELYVDGLSAADRHLLVARVSAVMSAQPAGHFLVNLSGGPFLLFYKALDPATQFAPAYQVCLYPLAASMHEERLLRWKIIAFGFALLVVGFVTSVFMVRYLSKPVDKIVAGSVENLTRRQEAERHLVDKNLELEKALTELKATQQQVIQQERLSAIGQMAAGVAHDFNNTLMPILGFSDLLLNNDALLGDKVEARKCLELVRTSAEDAASVVRRLREFYRPIEVDQEFPIVDLAKIVQQAVSLTEPKWRLQAQANGRTIAVTADFTARPIVTGEESALREVLTNLIFNAVDAMPEGGAITLTTSTEDHRAVVRVRDSGTGMTEAVRQRCLEPFFSTKGEQGTGLGLSMVYGIIERHRGKLEIESAAGQGTTFIIQLPLAEEMPLAQLAGAVSANAKSKSSLDVLIVDDEERVREVLVTYLRCDGHRVATAASGREALEKFRRCPFDLVVVDRVMPEMSGEQTARFIRQLNPSVPVIMLTGFGTLIEVTGSEPQAVDIVLSKPITSETLRTTIRKLLHAA
jgi:signal transduction histidine kinase/CheY-like chemotaxis protein